VPETTILLANLILGCFVFNGSQYIKIKYLSLKESGAKRKTISSRPEEADQELT